MEWEKLLLLLILWMWTHSITPVKGFAMHSHSWNKTDDPRAAGARYHAKVKRNRATACIHVV
jgi:hypothetical protein